MTHCCRGCNEPLKTVFADLGRSPLSNGYKTWQELQGPETTYPLTVYVCDACKLVQLPPHAKRESIFNKDYAYFSSYSQTMLDHMKLYAAEMIGRFNLGSTSLVVEVAGNDGYGLQFFKGKVPCVNVEPSANVAAASKQKGIETVVDFFGAKSALAHREHFGPPDLITAFNVLAHVPDIHDFIEGIKVLLAPAGTAVFEFPHLVSLINDKLIDSIYHEHYSYLSLLALEPIFAGHGLYVYDAELVSIHGASLRLFVGGADHAATDNTAKMRAYEEANGLTDLFNYSCFQSVLIRTKCELLDFLIDCRRHGERVVGYGAPAKATTLLNYCGIGSDLLVCTFDGMPSKQNKFIPGVQIPILEPGMLHSLEPKHILLLPWNLTSEIVPKILAAYAGEQPPRLWTAIPELEQVRL